MKRALQIIDTWNIYEISPCLKLCHKMDSTFKEEYPVLLSRYLFAHVVHTNFKDLFSQLFYNPSLDQKRPKAEIYFSPRHRCYKQSVILWLNFIPFPPPSKWMHLERQFNWPLIINNNKEAIYNDGGLQLDKKVMFLFKSSIKWNTEGENTHYSPYVSC